jgi:hypothetical protein
MTPKRGPAGLERHTHDRAELEAHDAFALPENIVGEGVGDDEGLARVEDLQHDGVGDRFVAFDEGFAVDVARDVDPGAPIEGEQEEGLVGAREQDELVEHRREQRLEGEVLHEFLSETVERGKAARVFAGGARARGRGWRRVGEREAEQVVAELDEVAVDELVVLLALAEHGDVCVAIGRGDGEAVFVVDDVGVMRRAAGKDDVVVAGRADTHDAPVERNDVRGAEVGGVDYEAGHRLSCPWGLGRPVGHRGTPWWRTRRLNGHSR